MDILRVKVLGSCIWEWEMSWKGGLIFGKGAPSFGERSLKEATLD